MMGWSFLAVAIPFIPVYVLVRGVSGRASGPMDRTLLFFLSLGLAFGVSSCTYFLWLVKPVPWLPGPVASEIVFFSCLCGVPLCFRRSRQALLRRLPLGEAGPSLSLPPRRERVPAWLSVCFGLVLAMAFCALLMVLSNKPHGSNDAYAVWNLRARFLFRGGDHWADGFSPLIAWSNPDYPLLLSATIARWWAYVGSDTILVPQFIALFFVLATAGLLIPALFRLRSASQGLVAGLFLFSTSFFMRLGGSQYADVPIGFFMLATVVTFSLKDANLRESPIIYSLAGLFAGCAAWTKNEGMLFVFAIFLARLISAILSGTESRKGLPREIAFFCAGLAPLLALLFFFKIKYAPPGDMFRNQGAGLFLQRMTDLHRYVMIVKAFWREIVRWGNGLFPILVVYALVSGIRYDSRHLRLLLTCAATLVLMFFGYFFIYAATPQDLAWMLGGSLERLLLQLWPTFLFGLFLVLTPFEGRRAERQRASRRNPTAQHP